MLTNPILSVSFFAQAKESGLKPTAPFELFEHFLVLKAFNMIGRAYPGISIFIFRLFSLSFDFRKPFSGAAVDQ